MPYARRTFTCHDCKQPTERRAAANAIVRCPGCAVAYSAEIQRQLAAHEGIHYERWTWAYALAARRIRSSSGPDESLKEAS